jgi:hypothetical protein
MIVVVMIVVVMIVVIMIVVVMIVVVMIVVIMIVVVMIVVVMIIVDVITDNRSVGVVVMLADERMRRHMQPRQHLEARHPEHTSDHGHPRARAAATR